MPDCAPATPWASRADGHLIRDSKLARTIDGDRHPEIRLQVQLYGFLYERLAGLPPAALQVPAGGGDLVPVAYDGGGAALGYLRFLRSLRAAATEPYEPVGWSKCGGCGFRRALLDPRRRVAGRGSAPDREPGSGL